MRINDVCLDATTVEAPTATVDITLSKRNLLALLAKLEQPPEAAKTIAFITDSVTLIVRAEDDRTHYKDRALGPIHPNTELRAQDIVATGYGGYMIKQREE